jgi:hypothetical protein
MARLKGSTGTYFRWPPERTAELWWDAEQIIGELSSIAPTKRLIAKLLKAEFPEKYKYVTEEQLRQVLSKSYLRKKNLRDYDAFNAAMWAHILGETDDAVSSGEARAGEGARAAPQMARRLQSPSAPKKPVMAVELTRPAQ